MNNAFAYDLVPSPSVITAALRAARRVNDYPTAVRIFEGMPYPQQRRYEKRWTNTALQESRQRWRTRASTTSTFRNSMASGKSSVSTSRRPCTQSRHKEDVMMMVNRIEAAGRAEAIEREMRRKRSGFSCRSWRHALVCYNSLDSAQCTAFSLLRTLCKISVQEVCVKVGRGEKMCVREF